MRSWIVGELSWRRMWTSFWTILAITYGYLLIYGAFFSDRQIFLPPPSSYEDTEQILKLTTSDGLQISALFLPHDEAPYTLLYSHGNAEDLGYALPHLQELQQIGFAVLAYDYRGYGTSQGTPSEQGTYKDIEAAYRYLTADLQIPPRRILVYGRSVGSGPAVDLAARRPVGGLILESPFVTAFRVLTRIQILPFDKFANIDKIQRVDVPVLILHGVDDELIPLWHGKALYEQAPHPKFSLWVEGAGHNDLFWQDRQSYIDTLNRFIEKLNELDQHGDQPGN